MTRQELISLIEQEGKAVYSFCCMLTGNQGEAEELYQEAMLSAVEHCRDIDSSQNPKGYLIGIVVRLHKDSRRKYARRQRIAPMGQLSEEMDAANPADCKRGSQDRIEVWNRRNETTMKWTMKKRISVAAAALVCVAAVSITGVAASKYLSREDVIEQLGGSDAPKSFEEGNVLEIYQTQEAGDYLFTLYEIATGGTLEERGLSGGIQNSDVREGGTYAVMAIARKDGSPMPATSSDAYRELEFFVSPLIQGLEPWKYNLASMGGNYGEMERDGVLYRVIGCDDIAIFADRKLYLCVNEDLFYNSEAFNYNEADGTITRNETYEGINLLFELPIDSAYANEEKAAEYLAAFDKPVASVQTGTQGELCPIEEAILRLEREKGSDVKKLTQIPAENLIGYGDLMEGSLKTVTITEDGRAKYSFFSEKHGWSMDTAAESLEQSLTESPDGAHFPSWLNPKK